MIWYISPNISKISSIVIHIIFFYLFAILIWLNFLSFVSGKKLLCNEANKFKEKICFNILFIFPLQIIIILYITIFFPEHKIKNAIKYSEMV
jgi:hypothetical protein